MKKTRQKVCLYSDIFHEKMNFPIPIIHLKHYCCNLEPACLTSGDCQIARFITLLRPLEIFGTKQKIL